MLMTTRKNGSFGKRIKITLLSYNATNPHSCHARLLVILVCTSFGTFELQNIIVYPDEIPYVISIIL